MPEAAQRLVRRYYVYGGIYTLAASIIWGVNTLFLLNAGLSIAEVFIANSAWALGTMLFEIPTGVVADTVGRRASFLLSLVVLAVTTLAYVGLAEIGAGVVAFSVVSALIGLGFTFYSGAMEAWLVDGLRFHGYDGELDQVFSRGQIVSGVGMLIGTIGGGVLGQVNLSIPFLVRSGLLIILFVLAFVGMHDLGFEPKRVKLAQLPSEATKIARAGIRFGWQQPSLRLMMLASAVQMGVFAWAWYAWQPYFLELLGRDLVWVAGVVAALLAISMMIGNAIVQIITRWCGRRTTLFLWSGGVFSFALIGVGVVDSFFPALALLFLGGVGLGVQMPVRQAFVHQIVPSEQRATVVSFDSMVSGGGSVVGQTSLGALSDQRGFSVGYIVGGLATLAAIPILALVRRQRDDADFFEGSRPEFASATPGVPAISQLDGGVTVDTRET
jgi:MFS family permease